MPFTLGDEWEEDRGSAGSRDFPESRPGLGGVGPLLLLLCSHFLNIERTRGDPESTVSIFSCAGTSKWEVIGGRSDDCGMGLDGPAIDIASSRRWPEEVGGESCSSINTEARGE